MRKANFSRISDKRFNVLSQSEALICIRNNFILHLKSLKKEKDLFLWTKKILNPHYQFFIEVVSDDNIIYKTLKLLMLMS